MKKHSHGWLFWGVVINFLFMVCLIIRLQELKPIEVGSAPITIIVTATPEAEDKTTLPNEDESQDQEISDGSFKINSEWVDFSDDQEWILKREKLVHREDGYIGSKHWGKIPTGTDEDADTYDEHTRDLACAHQYDDFYGPIDGLRSWLIYKAMIRKKLDYCMKMFKDGWILEAWFLCNELHTTGVGMSDNAESAKMYYFESLCAKAMVPYIDSCDKEWAVYREEDIKHDAMMFGNERWCKKPSGQKKYYETFLAFKKKADKLTPGTGKFLTPDSLRWHSDYPSPWEVMGDRKYSKPSDNPADCNMTVPSDSSCRMNMRCYKHPELIYALRAPK